MGWCDYVICCNHNWSLYVYGGVSEIIFKELCIKLINNFNLGEVCSHLAGVLFKVEASVRLGVAAMTCTSLPCTWNQAFSKKVCAVVEYDVVL